MPTCKVCGVKIRKDGRYCRLHKYEGCKEQDRKYKQTWYKADQPKKEEIIKRMCLRCNKPFMAEGRFNRICPSCKGINEGVIDPQRYGVLSLSSSQSRATE